MSRVSDDVLWEKVLGVLGADDRLKRFLKLPRHELIGLMKAHGSDVTESLFILYRLVESGYKAEASQLVLHWGDYKAFAMILYVVRSIRIWRTESLTYTGRKFLEV